MTCSSSAALRRAALALAALLPLAAAPARAARYDFLPESEQTFPQLLADPRAIQLGASYYRMDGKDRSDVALGHSWGMTRWSFGDGAWSAQWNIEALAMSRFTIGGSINSFETVDFLGNLPVSFRSGKFSTRAMLFHESSHLGDDYIRQTGNTGFRYSIDGLRVTFAWESDSWIRVYTGMTYLLHTIPDPARKTAQAGFELTSPDLKLSPSFPIRLFLAEDLQSHENVAYNVNSRTMAGVSVGFKEVRRTMRVYFSYFDGHSPYGQFYGRREHWAELGVGLHF